MDEALNFENGEEWRNWLTQNHKKQDHIWLVLHKRCVITGGINLEEAVEEAICFGWIDGKLRKIDETRFALRVSPRKPKSVWSKINRERAEKLIESGRMTDAGRATIDSAKMSGSWDNSYTSKTKEALPTDLEEALMENDLAWANFQHFANSHRNIYIDWINSSKTSETRATRIRKVVEQSLQNKKLL
jgi:uncharacterized protein YdeI (YjbR/CyaY-like superfamily)